MPFAAPNQFLNKYIYHNNYLKFWLLFICVAAIFVSFQLTESFPDPDAFYHMKMGQLIWGQGIITDFPWQQFTVLKDYYIDHHLLYHLLLIPFVNFINPLLGIKLAIIFLASTFILILALIFKALKLKGGAIIGLLVALTTPFTFRFNLVKANSLSLILLFLGIYLAYKRKYLWLFLISFLYVWAYGGFILLLLVVGLYVIIDWIYSKKLSWKLLLTIISGFAAGIIINPYFPKNLLFYWQQLVQIGIINYQDKIGVGGEWYPYGFVELIQSCSLLTLLSIMALISFALFIKKQKSLNWFSMILYLIGLFLVLKSRRYIEYYVPFAAFFVITSLDIFLSYFNKQKIVYFFFGFWRKSLMNKIIFFVIIVYLLLIIPAVLVKDYQINYRDLKNGSSYYKFQKAGAWLKNNSAKGAVVLHSDWDEFPLLFYHNSHNYYIVGLDPTFMYNYDQELYWQWVNITIGQQKEDLPEIIANQFSASYVFLEKDHAAMDNNIRKFPDEFKLVYEDEEAKIYKTTKPLPLR